MRNFIKTTISTSMSQEDMHSILSNELPEYIWRMGDSDQQGKYVRGNGQGQIQSWVEDNIVEVSISCKGSKSKTSKYYRLEK